MLVNYFWHVNSSSKLGKYLTCGRDKHYTTRLQRATQIVEDYRNDWEGHLQIIDPYSMEIWDQSQTNPNTRYALNLRFECCECNDWVGICKHVSDVIGLEVKHLKILLSSNKEEFLHVVHENFEVEAGRSTKNDTLFDNEGKNPAGMS